MNKIKFFLVALIVAVALFTFSPQDVSAKESFTPAPYTEPVAPICVGITAQVSNDQKFSRQEKIVIVFVNISYRWHITAQTGTTVTYQLQKDINPTNDETWINVSDVTRTLDIPNCTPIDETPVSTPSATVTTSSSNSNNGGGVSMPSAPTCNAEKPGDVENINVVQGAVDDTVLVQWSIPVRADKVHILYWETGHSNSEHGFAHALLNASNDGSTEIHMLKANTKYSFAVVGVNGCMVGNFSHSFDQLP